MREAYIQNAMYTNKISSVSYENSITMTPIKMEINLSSPIQQRANINTNVNDFRPHVEAGDEVRMVTNNSNTISSNFSNTTAGANLLNSTSCTIKEKLRKAIKPSMPRKPPPTIENFWPNVLNEMQTAQMVDAKHQALPLARIKKIMKLDENAKMIAAEAPLLFAKACELFIQELTMRAWIHTEESKRRTLQRSDIAQAIANYDQFDFLIDIVPREDIKPTGHHRKHENSQTGLITQSATSTSANSAAPARTQCTVTGTSTIPGIPIDMISVSTNDPANVQPIPQMIATPAITANNNAHTAHVITSGQSPQQVQIIQQTSHHPTQHMQYFITLPGQTSAQPPLLHQLQVPQQQQSQLTHSIGAPLTASGLNLITQTPQQLILTAAPTSTNAGVSGVHTQGPQQQAPFLQSVAQQQQQVQIVQQVVVTPTGEITNVPQIAVNANQLNLLRFQMQQHQQQQQTHQPTQQIIIPTQLLPPQQLLQLQAQTQTTHQVPQQQQQQHQQTANGIFIQHTTNPAQQSTTTSTNNPSVSA